MRGNSPLPGDYNMRMAGWIISIAFCTIFCLTAAGARGIDIGPGENEPPEAVISEPKEEDTYYEGVPVPFNASGSKDNDTAVLYVHWSSDRDGYLGNLVIHERALSAGTHVITLYVSDGEDNSSAEVTITVLPNPGQEDTDSDGIPDTEDLDDDGDGIPDSWEIDNQLDPKDPMDMGADPDGDGLSNADEFDLGTDPRDMDTDGDGVGDGEDPDPLNPNDGDSDGDGIGDSEELENGTDPYDPDSDGDGVDDGEDRYPLDAERTGVDEEEIVPAEGFLIGVLSLICLAIIGRLRSRDRGC